MLLVKPQIHSLQLLPHRRNIKVSTTNLRGETDRITHSDEESLSRVSARLSANRISKGEKIMPRLAVISPSIEYDFNQLLGGVDRGETRNNVKIMKTVRERNSYRVTQKLSQSKQEKKRFSQQHTVVQQKST